MEIKILQVFYDKNGLPYKDKERTVHYPITSGTFLGASNTTQIRFYYDQLDELNESTFVAVSKLPNGKIGSEILESEYDGELQENYAVLNLSQFYTQYKGDVYISLQGYQGGVRVEQDENGIYQIYGTPTIQATGSIKLSIAYAPTFVGSGQTENITLQRVLAELSTKLGIRQETLHVEELPTVGNPNVWYVVNDDPNDTTKANIYIWNAKTQTYVWVGDNTLDLGDYYTQEQGEQFENGIDNRVTSVENELESVASGSPKGVYATLAALQAAYPTGTTGIYVVSADGHWYYWNGSAWTDGGLYLSVSADQHLDAASQNAIQNQVVALELSRIINYVNGNEKIELSAITWTDGYIYMNDGSLYVAYSPWSISNEIDISTRKSNLLLVRMASQQLQEGESVAYNIFLDENHNFISSVRSIYDANNNGDGYGIIDVPSNAKYIKVSLRTPDKNNFAIYNLTFDSARYSRISILNKEDSELGSVNYESGNNYETVNWTRTKYIDISKYANKYVIVPSPNYNTVNAGFVWYDENKTYISGFGGRDGSTILWRCVKVPSNAKYCRFSLLNSFWNSSALIAPILEDTIIAIYNSLNETSGYLYNFLFNGKIQIIQKDYSLSEGAVWASTGADYETPTWSRTTYFDVSKFAGRKVTICLPTWVSVSSDAGSAFYDENKQFIVGYDGDVTGQNSYELKTITIPQNAKYCRMSLRTVDIDKLALYESLENFLEQNLPEPEEKIEKSNLLINKQYENPISIPVGISNQIVFDKIVDIDTVSIKAKVTLTDSNSVLAMGSKDDLGAYHASYIEFDFANKQIKIYENGTGLTIPNSIIATESFSSIAGDSTKFICEVGREERQVYAKITNFWTGQFVKKTIVENDLQIANKYKYPAGWLEDYPTISLRNGSATLDYYVISIPRNIDFAFIGDSITEGFGIAYEDSWCYKAKQYFGNSAGMGRSGATIVISQKQVEDIISIMQPKYTIVTIGTNGGNNLSRLQKIIETIKKCGSIPVINCIAAYPQDGSASLGVNDVILGLKKLGVRFDIATSINNNPSSGQNSALFQSDNVHPNEQGNTAMYNRLLVDIGNLKGE